MKLEPRTCDKCGGSGGGPDPATSCPACGGKGTIPLMDLPFHRVLCSRHGEPFGAQWPRGYLLFALSAVQKTLELPEVQEASGGSVEAVPTLLDEKPACCRLSPDKLLALYREVAQETGVWEQGHCENCRHFNLGGPYRVLNHWGRQVEYRHICLECVVKWMRPLEGKSP